MTYEQCLAACGGDAAKAAQMYAGEVARAATAQPQNQQPAIPAGRRLATDEDARNRIIATRVARALRTVGIELPDVRDESSAEAFGSAVDVAVASVSARLSEGGDAILRDIGFDYDSYRAADAAKRAEIVAAFTKAHKEGSAEATRLQQELNLRDAAAELGYDPRKLANLKGSEGIKRAKVKVKATAEDGTTSEREEDAWVFADDRPVAEHVQQLGFTAEQLAPTIKAAEAATGQGLGATVNAAQVPAQGKSGNDASWLG